MLRALHHAAVVLAGCGMSERTYCERLQAAWERAFPDQPQSPDQRNLFIVSCTSELTRAPRTELKRRIRCLERHLRGGKNPQAEYQAMVRCEGGGVRPAP